MMVSASFEPITAILLCLLVLGLALMLSRYIAYRCHKPTVLVELLVGIIIGNIGYFLGWQVILLLREGPIIYPIFAKLMQGDVLLNAVNQTITNPADAPLVYGALMMPYGLDHLNITIMLDILARLGLLLLLFSVGLESSIAQLRQTGRQSLLVAIIGVLTPLILGFFASLILLPKASIPTALFVGATLCATSIGISARVLKESNQLQSQPAQIILGAAVIDDILALIILAIVSNVIVTGGVDGLPVIYTILMSVAFFSIVITLGPKLITALIAYSKFLNPREQCLFISLFTLCASAFLAVKLGLAAIIGAFSAGVLLNNDRFNSANPLSPKLCIHDVILPLESLLAPLFFMLMGVQVKLETFVDPTVLILAFGLVVVAIIGKLLSGLGAAKHNHRLLIGIGMLPRGEVGLVFAASGRVLGVMNDQLFSAIVLMIIVTTAMTPYLLKKYINSQTMVGIHD